MLGVIINKCLSRGPSVALLLQESTVTDRCIFWEVGSTRLVASLSEGYVSVGKQTCFNSLLETMHRADN